MRSRTMRAEHTSLRAVIVTLDLHLARIVARAADELAREVPGLALSIHAAAEWENNPSALARCKADLASADIIFCTMIFLEDHVRAIKDVLVERRETCDALFAMMSAPEIVKLTRIGDFSMDKPSTGVLALIKKLRRPPDAKGMNAAEGAKQLRMLRRLPKILRLIPGKAQDVRAYFLVMQYFIAGSQANIVNMVRLAISRYADGPRRALRAAVGTPNAPIEYPEIGVYHPAIPAKISDSAADVPKLAGQATVGLIVLRSYVLANDTAHYDGVIRSLEAKGLRVVPIFASGLDARPAIEKYFQGPRSARLDALVSLTGFSLVGGPAYNDSAAAQETLAQLDIPYVMSQPVEFQTLERWAESIGGLTPVEATMMVAIPEIDGAIAPIVFGGRSEGSGRACKGCARACRFETNSSAMQSCGERADLLADRVARLIALRATAAAEKKLAIVLFNFPPNSGAAGSAAYLSVFASLFNTMKSLKRDGYSVEVPETVDALRDMLLQGNSQILSTDTNIHAQIPVDDHIRRETYLSEIEKHWGSAPGRHLTNGRALYIPGRRFGNIFVGFQPSIGIEGDPMRLLFDGAFAPTHAFSAFYRYLREDFGAHAVLHFGTHGSLEFMPGKQVGLSAKCWPERLLGALPNFYFYAANNPSEAAIAKRRSAATLLTYLTPSVTQAGLYRGLTELKELVDRFGAAQTDDERRTLREALEAQAGAVDLGAGEMAANDDQSFVERISSQLYEFEQTLIPHGLHVIGEVPSEYDRVDTLESIVRARGGLTPARASLEFLVAGGDVKHAAALSALPPAPESLALFRELKAIADLLAHNEELTALGRALDGGYIRPTAGGDLIHSAAILPTGRNLHGFDPLKIPTAFAIKEGARQAKLLLDRHFADEGALPETVAFVLWGTDNLKTQGAQIAQVLALMGARGRFDSYGRLCGAELVPLAELGRPRIDVMTTLSGIFRDLLPMQTKLIAEAAYLAATADEPVDMNFVRKHTLAHQSSLNCDLEVAALRVFSNAEGAYGSNVNHMIDTGCWTDGDELANAYQSRKCFAYNRAGKCEKQSDLLGGVLASVDLAYQDLESLELGVTSVDHYVDTLGGISRAVRRAKGAQVPVYVGDQTQGKPKVRTLAEQVVLETRTRTLNPRWHESLLAHGYEGVRQIEAHVTNTMGWSATTDQVAPWIYQKISETFVLDEEMRERLVSLNPKASARLANRLIEAHERKFWTPDEATLRALRDAGNEIEDHLEGVHVAAAE